jgi:molecular chaperone HscA
MSLLQIQDPKKRQQELVVGIDFGTTNSLIAFSQDHKPFIIDDKLVPSVLNFDGHWSAAYEQNGVNVRSIKRILGKSYQQIIGLPGIDPALKALLCEHNDQVKIKIDGALFDPVELASLIFSKLKSVAEESLEGRVAKAVITVPAYFDDRQKSAVKKSAKLAGIECLRLMSEPTAAGFAYGINNSASGQYLVYDFGGGTFDVSLVRIADKITQVVAVAGDDALGGDDIDHAIADYLSQKYGKQIPLALARQMKEDLSSRDAVLDVCEVSITAQEYEQIAMPIVEKTITLTKEVMKHGADIKGIILVGGSSRVPLVKKLLPSFGVPIFDNIDPDTAVALGAALQAENLSRSKSHVLLDVVSLSLGIEVMGGLNEKIIFRNTPIPTCAIRHFTTHADNQNAMKLHILQGEREFAKDCRSIGFFELKGIPPMAAGMPKIEISFMVDVDGLLYVSATESASGVSQELIVNIDAHLPQQELDEMLQDAMKNATIDHENKLLKEAILKGENFIAQVRKILEKLAMQDEGIELAIAELKKALQQNNTGQIDLCIQKLDELFSPICAKHFNSQISALLQGNKI